MNKFLLIITSINLIIIAMNGLKIIIKGMTCELS